MVGSPRLRHVVLLLAALATTASLGCAASRVSSRPERLCDRSDQDTTHYLHVPLYRPCAVYVQARPLAGDLQPDFMPARRGPSCYSAVIEVAVDTRGLPEVRTARVVRTNDARYAQAVLALVPNLTFQPAVLGGQRVRQLVEIRQSMVVRRVRRTDGPTGPDLPLPSAPSPC